MNRTAGTDLAKLAELAKALPDRIKDAERGIDTAQEQLANLLAWRAAGAAVEDAELDKARNALAQAKQEREDLHAIAGVLPAITEQARSLVRVENRSSAKLAKADARQVFNAALAELKVQKFMGLSRAQIKALGAKVRELAHKAGRIAEFKVAVEEDLCRKLNGDVLLELI